MDRERVGEKLSDVKMLAVPIPKLALCLQK